MFKSKWIFAFTFVACALFLAATVYAKDMVTRPLKIKSEGIVAYTDANHTVVTETGVATHTGSFLSHGVGTITVPHVQISYDTDMFTANGDVINWKGLVTFTSFDPVTLNLKFTVDFSIDGNSSTGRFAGASGHFSGTGFTAYYNPPDSEYPGGFWTTSYSVTGTITY